MATVADALYAVVVTFHPDDAVMQNLKALRSQVRHLVVVDNGSSEEELAPLRELTSALDFVLIEHGNNLGIATALNTGVLAGFASGMEWVILFDQDSRVSDDFVAAMLRGWRQSPWGARLGILTPRYVDSRLGTALPATPVKEGDEAAMTSGSMMRLEIFTSCGYFVDELFIDGVDYEYSLRLRAAGLVIDECPTATLLHAPGEPRRHKLLGVLPFQTANYSPVRRYYQERNKIWVAKRYIVRFPVFCLKLFLFSSKDFVKILVAEEGKGRKLSYFLRGVFDGIFDRMGKLKEPAR